MSITPEMAEDAVMRIMRSANKPLKRRDIADLVLLSQADLDRALRSLRLGGWIKHENRFWKLAN